MDVYLPTEHVARIQSRIGSLLSGLFSPFRSSSKKAEVVKQREAELQRLQREQHAMPRRSELISQDETVREAAESEDLEVGI